MNREEWRTKATAQTQENKRLLGSKLDELTDMYLISLLTQKELQEELDESHAKIAELYHENERLRLELKGCEFCHKKSQEELERLRNDFECHKETAEETLQNYIYAHNEIYLFHKALKQIADETVHTISPAQILARQTLEEVYAERRKRESIREGESHGTDKR